LPDASNLMMTVRVFCVVELAPAEWLPAPPTPPAAAPSGVRKSARMLPSLLD
jgi:hypothetical protein